MRESTIHPAVAALSFDRPVTPAEVNRKSPAEVFATDAARLAADEFAVAVRLPHDHALWSDRRAPWHDTLTVVEAFRQALVLVRYRYLEVAAGTPSGVQQMEFAVGDPAVFRAAPGEPLECVLIMRVTRSPIGDGLLDIAGACTTPRGHGMTFSAGSVVMPRGVYDEIRAYQRSRKRPGDAGPVAAGRATAGPVDPAAVGRRDPRNVVVGRPAEVSGRYPLVVDRTHPSFFDKSYDHVPGTLLLEAARQSVLLAAAEAGPAAVTRCRLSFATFVELDALCECSVTVERGPRSVTGSVGFHQYGERIAEGELELSRLE
ncbi:AfsA-related hotdog domain-containing protein [Actinoplanes sp. NPDC026619]|uniref:AfsA-related hotdog domain-containing protein n=1 Tax=Actinoplanes sp. NPDC026619 TaxID=3155798 RepID=UPI00340852C7